MAISVQPFVNVLYSQEKVQLLFHKDKIAAHFAFLPFFMDSLQKQIVAQFRLRLSQRLKKLNWGFKQLIAVLIWPLKKVTQSQKYTKNLD